MGLFNLFSKGSGDLNERYAKIRDSIIRKAYGVLTVLEMKHGVKDKLYSLDQAVAKYMTK